MTPHQITPPAIETLTAKDVEQIARRVFAEMKAAIETQQALLVQEVKAVNATLVRIEHGMESNFVRKESFEAVQDQVRRNTSNMAKGAWALVGAFLTALSALLFKQ